MLTVQQVVDYLRLLAPPELAESWDNVGLLLGDPAAAADRIMTCLTITPTSAAEARGAGAGLVVSHHPVLFRPTQRLTAETPAGRMLLGLIHAGVAVYSPHTAFDNTQGGMNDILCRRLGLGDAAPLRPAAEEPACKLVVFVPEQDLARVSEALFQAGAGNIGEYSHCSFRLAGTGTFWGGEGTNPAVGQKGRLEEVSEWRLEAVCPMKVLPEVIRSMRRAHSYEEPAFDVYPLHVFPGGRGKGRVGTLPSAEPLEAFARRVQTVLKTSSVQVVGDGRRPVRRVALACGAAGEFLADAIRARADVFLTGEMRFHDLAAAEAEGIALVLPGHFATERPGVEELAAALASRFPEANVWASRSEQDPLRLAGE